MPLTDPERLAALDFQVTTGLGTVRTPEGFRVLDPRGRRIAAVPPKPTPEEVLLAAKAYLAQRETERGDRLPAEFFNAYARQSHGLRPQPNLDPEGNRGWEVVRWSDRVVVERAADFQAAARALVALVTGA